MVDADSIKAALEAIADQAPHAGRVRARIEARGRVHRSRRAFVVAAGALGTVAAVGVPLVTARKRSRPVVAASPSPSASVSREPEPEEITLSFLYAPAWLPAGMVEAYRQVTSDSLLGGVVVRPQGSKRIWLPEGRTLDDRFGFLRSVEVDVNDTADWNFTESSEIGPKVVAIAVDADSAILCWKSGPGVPVTVTVRRYPDNLKVATQVMRSVARTTTTMSYRLNSPWVPSRFLGFTSAFVRTTPDGGWMQNLSHQSADRLLATGVSVSNRPGIVPASLSWTTRRADGTYVSVTKDPSGARTSITETEARQMMAEFRFAAPDMSWAR